MRNLSSLENITALKGSRKDVTFIFRGKSLVHNAMDELVLFHALPYYKGKPPTENHLRSPVPVKTCGQMDYIKCCFAMLDG